MKRRHCKKCNGYVRPTRKIHATDHKMFKCIDCGSIAPWLDAPVLNDAHAELHRMNDGSFSVLSMLSDPNMEWKKVKQTSSRKRKVRSK